jgi:hypothetical protein
MRARLGPGFIIGLVLLSVSCAHKRPEPRYFVLDPPECGPYLDIRKAEKSPTFGTGMSEAAVLVVEYPVLVSFTTSERYPPHHGPYDAGETYLIQIPPGKHEVEIGLQPYREKGAESDWFPVSPIQVRSGSGGVQGSSFWWSIRSSGSASSCFSAIPGHMYCIELLKRGSGERHDDERPPIRTGKQEWSAAIVDCTVK